MDSPKWFCFFIFFFALSAKAQVFKLKINTTDAGWQSLPSEIQTQVAAEIKKVENRVNDDFPSADPSRLLTGMADSTAMAGKGVGNDYVTDFSVFTLGAGVGVGVDLEKQDDFDSDISGAGLMGGLVFGLNLGILPMKTLGFLDLSKLNVMVNFFSYDYDNSEKTLSADTSSMGIHFNYQVLEGHGTKLLFWDGLKIHVGVQKNETNFSFTEAISEVVNQTVSASGNDYNLSGTLTGNPRAGIEVSTTSIPIELSTGVRLLYFLSLYSGLGVDFNSGEATAVGGLDAPESTIVCSGAGAACNDTEIKVTPEANLTGVGTTQSTFFRVFAGLQFNLPYFRIFTQVNKELSSDLLSANAGLRLAF